MSGRIGVAVLVAAALITGCTAGSHGRAATAPAQAPSAAISAGETIFALKQREHVPSLSAETLDGSVLAIDGLLGVGVVVVNVWASWCTECRAESRGLAKLSRELRGRGVRFVGIDEHDSSPNGRRFAAASGVRYPQLVDPDGILLAQLTPLPSSGIPSTLVIDRHGLMSGRIVGAADAARLRSLIAKIAARH